jgi:predicted kinase
MEMIVFSGIQGVGKTTYFQREFAYTHVRIGLDLMRTRNREDIILHACLAAQQPLVIDNTNPTAAQRARFASLGKAAGFRTKLYFFDAPLEIALVRNEQRAASMRVPEIGIRGTIAKLQHPTPAEPFDEIVVLTLDHEGNWQTANGVDREVR